MKLETARIYYSMRAPSGRVYGVSVDTLRDRTARRAPQHVWVAWRVSIPSQSLRGAAKTVQAAERAARRAADRLDREAR